MDDRFSVLEWIIKKLVQHYFKRNYGLRSFTWKVDDEQDIRIEITTAYYPNNHRRKGKLVEERRTNEL